MADANVMASHFVCAELKKHSQFDLVGCAATVGELLELFERRKAKVALISSTLQDGLLSSLAIFPQLREKHPDVRLILMIDHPEPELVVEAFRAGARGIFTCYESQFDALCKCISCVHSGQVWANARQLDCLIDAVAQVPTVRLVNAKGANLLSKREEEVVRQVAEGLSNHDIAQQLHLSDHTVKNHLFHIFEKLGISNRVELVLYTVSHSKRPAMPVSRDDSPAVMPGNRTH
ncbi:MAG: LuxR C-terminal-related transcriptional regulator [Terriglobales bacterium]